MLSYCVLLDLYIIYTAAASIATAAGLWHKQPEKNEYKNILVFRFLQSFQRTFKKKINSNETDSKITSPFNVRVRIEWVKLEGVEAPWMIVHNLPRL